MDWIHTTFACVIKNLLLIAYPCNVRTTSKTLRIRRWRLSAAFFLEAECFLTTDWQTIISSRTNKLIAVRNSINAFNLNQFQAYL